MKKLTKILTLSVAIAVMCALLFSLTACYKYSVSDLKNVQAEDAENETYSIAVKKGDPQNLLPTINEVITELKESGELEKIKAYHKNTGGGIVEKPAEVDFSDCKNGVLTVSTNAEFNPYEYFKGEEIVGIDVDIMKHVAKKLGKTLKMSHVEFESVLGELTTGKADVAAAAITMTQKRAQEVDFSIEYEGAVQFIISADGYSKIADLKGKKIAVQQGTTGDMLVTAAIEGTKEGNDPAPTDGLLKDTGAAIERYSAPATALLALRQGKIDAIVVDQAVANKLLAA